VEILADSPTPYLLHWSSSCSLPSFNCFSCIQSGTQTTLGLMEFVIVDLFGGSRH
jgi:hypothetical protein